MSQQRSILLLCLLFSVASAWNPQQHMPLSRRQWIAVATAITTTVTTTSQPSQAADDRLFRPNPLTNPLLEQLRIWEQAEADTLNYGGELEAGDAGNKGQVQAYPRLLVPILQIAHDVEHVSTLVTTTNNYPTALAILQQPYYETLAFKKIFNAYGDNIYYADPDRANVYLGGGATPKTEQSLAYLLRNELLTSLQDLRAELEYVIRNQDDTGDDDDVPKYAQAALSAIRSYLDLVPPQELQTAQQLLQSAQP